MTVLRGLLERRGSLENPSNPITGNTLANLMIGPTSASGVAVSETSAMQMPAVWRAVNLLAGTAASLPLKAYKVGTQDPAAAQLLTTPHPDMTPYELWETAFTHMLLWGNCYLQKVRNGAGAVVELWPIHPSRVKVARVKVAEGLEGGKLFEVDGKTPLTSREILHIPGIGYDGVTGVSPIRLATQAIGLGLAAEQYASRLYASGALMSGILQTEQRLEQGAADRLKANWQAKVSGLSNAHDIAVLDSGASFQEVSMPATDAQMIESRRYQTQEIARWFGIPPHMLGEVSGSTSWGTGIEQQSIGFVVYTLRPWLSRFEQRITKEATPTGVYAKFKVEGLLRGDSAARGSFYNTMRMVGAYSANDIRRLEDEPPIDGGDDYLVPLNMAVMGEEPAEQGALDVAAE